METMVMTLLAILPPLIIWMAHPILLSMTLLALSTLCVVSMNSITGFSWFPLMFFLLFTGGIIVMFLILSSLVPNQPMNKKSSFNTTSTVIILMSTLIGPFKMINQASSQSTLSSKIMLMETTSFTVMTVLILTYFIILSGLVLEIETPLRSEKCHKQKNFVNF